MNPGAAVLYVPADKERALAKAYDLDATAFIFDLEDAVSPAAKVAARETLRRYWTKDCARPRAIRINGIGTEHFTEDLLLARKLMPDAIVLPKVGSADDLRVLETALAETDAPTDLAIWAMIETARGVLDLASIAAHGERLSTLVAGTNDLVAETGVSVAGGREHLHTWLLQIVLAARANGLHAIDGVTNAFRDETTVAKEAREAAALGFDGKTLIHPNQIAPTLQAFRPTDDRLAEARAIVQAFDNLPSNVGVATVNGRLVERLHLMAAQRDLAKIGQVE